MKLRFILVPVFFLCFFVVQAQEITSPGFGKGILKIVAKDSSFSMNFSARFQGLYTTNWISTGEDQAFLSDGSSMMIRRSRLKFNGFAYSPRLRYKMEFGLSNRDMAGASIFTSNAPRLILDAVLQWNFYKNFELWAGQTKLPGNRERVISSGDLQFVDRSLLNSRFNIDRDVGIQLRHNFNPSGEWIIREIFAISQGEGRNVTTGNVGGYQYTTRLEVLPFGYFTANGDYVGSDLQREPFPKLSVAGGFDHNADAVKTRSNSGTYMVTDSGYHQTNITTVFIDAMFKYSGFSFMGEFVNRSAEEPIARNEDGTLTGEVVNVGNGINLQAGYLLKNNMEFAGRYTKIGLDQITGVGREQQYTLAISKFFAAHKLKIQSDISYLDSKNDTTNQFLYRLQFDIHF